MKNKVLVKICIPEIDLIVDAYLPINKKMGNIINLINKAVSEITDNEFIIANDNVLYNTITRERYQSDILLANTNIRNGTSLVLLSK